jgi:DNA polymerase-4
MAILHDLTPLMEQVSIDEAFLDVSDLPKPAEEIARELQAKIRAETLLPCSLGVASNKLVAKIATDVGKAARRGPTYPNAIQVVAPGREADFLAPLPVGALWGVGPKTAERLASMGVHTVGELARYPEAALVRQFGKWGHDLAKHANGIDDQPVIPFHAVKSISQEVTYDRDVADRERLKRTLQHQAEQVGFRLRRNRLCGNTVRLKLRWPDFTTLTRQLTLDSATDQDGVIIQAAFELFDRVWEPGKAVRLLGVGVSGLTPCAHQLSLWDTGNEKERRLLSALDELRERFGEQAVQRGTALKKSRREKRRGS